MKPMTSKKILKILEDLGIQVETHHHDAVFTAEEAMEKTSIESGVGTKNLFLRDQKGKRHILVVQEESARADLSQLAEQLQCRKLSFASSERLLKYLGVQPGSVGILGLIHDVEKAVENAIANTDEYDGPQIKTLLTDAPGMSASDILKLKRKLKV